MIIHNMRPTYHYSKKLTAGATQAIFPLPQLRNISIINISDSDIVIEFENDITTDSVVVLSRAVYELPTGFIDVRYKSLSGSVSFFIAGLLHQKA